MDPVVRINRESLMGIGVLAMIALASGLFLSRNGSAAGQKPDGWPATFEFACTACDHHWSEADESAIGQRFGAMPTHREPLDCVKCGVKKAYWMVDCPWCHKPYLSKFQKDPRSDSRRDPCPDCGQDAMAWKPSGQ